MYQEDNNLSRIELFLEAFIECGISFAAGVPDSLLAELSQALDQSDDFHHVISANEGLALSLGIGHSLGEGRPSLIYLQNSGLGNIVNPYLSLAHRDVFNIPSVFVVGWRGQNPNSDEPQHKAQGLKTEKLLELLDLPTLVLKEESNIYKDTFDFLSKLILNDNSGAILVSKDTFLPLVRDEVGSGVTRKRAIEIIYNKAQKDTRFFATTGKTARELNEVNENLDLHKCFFSVGGMGHVSSIALGYKLSNPEVNVICLDGDGSLLMHLGTLASFGSLQPRGFTHIIFDNKVHESVGGQSIACTKIDYLNLFKAFNFSRIYEVSSESELEKIINILENKNELTAIIVKTKNYSDPNLTRPKGNPKQWKQKFITI